MGKEALAGGGVEIRPGTSPIGHIELMHTDWKVSWQTVHAIEVARRQPDGTGLAVGDPYAVDKRAAV